MWKGKHFSFQSWYLVDCQHCNWFTNQLFWRNIFFDLVNIFSTPLSKQRIPTPLLHISCTSVYQTSNLLCVMPPLRWYQAASGSRFWRYSIGHRSWISCQCSNQCSNQLLQLESVAARVLKLLHASSRFLKQ